MPSNLSPSSVQEAVIDLNFNTFVLNILLFGTYTVVYFGTVYVYLTKKSSKRPFVVGTISLAYLVYAINTSVQWFLARQSFVKNGQTQESIFISELQSPTWTTFVVDVCNFVLAVLADVLLIWRCFNVWGHSVYAISLPSFLLFAEIMIYLTNIIFTSAVHLDPSPSQANAINTLLAAASFITVGTTLVTTLLISYRIHSFSKQDVTHGTRARFHHILEVIVQSAAVYCIITIASATATAIPTPMSLEAKTFVPVLAAQTYTTVLFLFAAGVSPTIMVARVAITKNASQDILVVAQISDIQFQGQLTVLNATQSKGNDIHVEPGRSPLAQEFR